MKIVQTNESNVSCAEKPLMKQLNGFNTVVDACAFAQVTNTL